MRIRCNEAKGEYTVYFFDTDDDKIIQDGTYPTWQKAYDALTDGGARVRGDSTNFVYDGTTLSQVYKYKKTGNTGKWSGTGYEVIWSKEISSDPVDYILNNFVGDSPTSCHFKDEADD